MMEDKQLNLNQPLLSVRRFSLTAASTEVGSRRKNDSSFSSIPPLPAYKSELKSGPVINPGSVPFVWEQTPGRPKDESKPWTGGPEPPPSAPKLPPGRILNTIQRPPDKVSKDPIVAGAQTPNVLYNPQSVPCSLDENVSKLRTFKGVEDKGSSGSEDGDFAYLDALDALSQSESFFLNCSVSGLTGLDSQDVKTFGAFSTDPQTRDFMMGRFLPAAKAMASETPPYASRRLRVAQVQPGQVKKEVSKDKRLPPHQYGPNAHCAQDKVRGESDDEVDYDETELSGKVCGLFPWFGLANSFCLTNPVLGMGVETRVPASSLRGVRAGFSYRDAKTINKPNSLESSRNGVDEKRSGGLQRRKLQKLRREEENENKKASHKNESQKPDGSSLYTRFQGSGMLPYRSDSLLSHFHEEKGFHGICEEPTSFGVDGFGSNGQGPKSFRELLASSPERESGLESPAVEKTLYIDTVHIIEPRNSHSSCLDMKLLSDSNSDSEIIERSMIPTMESSVQDIKYLSITDEEGGSQPKFLDFMDSSPLSSSVRSDEEVHMEQRKALRMPDPVLGSLTLDGPQVLDNRNQEDDNHWLSEANSLEKFQDSNSVLPLPPPLPKSPSESWLSRTLPSVSAKNPQTHFGAWMNTKNGASETSSPDPKCGKIAKIYNARQGHSQFSQKLLDPVPES